MLRAEAELAVTFTRNVFKAIILSFPVQITNKKKIDSNSFGVHSFR